MVNLVAGVWRLARFVTRHPISRGRPAYALKRMVRWQVGARILGLPVIVNWVGGSRLIVDRGMAGATGNLYVGLHEYADMAFLLHFLRENELFLDVGANVGSYTVLASAACGARSMSFEPVPTTYRHLRDNVLLNDGEGRARTFNVAVGANDGQIRFSSTLDTSNRALGLDEALAGSIMVPVKRLDDIVADESVALIKMDVEGYEDKVIDGAGNTLARTGAVIMELSGPGSAHEERDQLLCSRLRDHGFQSVRYDPEQRKIDPIDTRGRGGNVLFIRDLAHARERVRTAPKFTVLGREL